MEKLDIRSIIVVAEELFLSIQNAKQTNLQGLEVQTDRKLQGGLVKGDELIKRLHMLDQKANPGDYKTGNKDDVATKDSTVEIRSD